MNQSKSQDQTFTKKVMDLARSFFDATFLKYVIINLSVSAVGTGIMYLLYNAFNVSYWASSVTNQVFDAVVVFFLDKRFAFNVREWTAKLVVLYIVNTVVCYAIAYGTIARPLSRFAFNGMGVTGQENMAMMVGVIAYKILDYFGQRFLVFRKKLNRGDDTGNGTGDNTGDNTGDSTEAVSD